MSKKPNVEHLKTWRLFLTVHARLIAQIDDRLRRGGKIPLNWYDVLIELYEAPNQRLRMRELAERVLLTRSGLTRLVDQLEKQGYLTREMDSEDRRGFYATITADGIQALQGAWTIYADGINTLFAQHMNEEDAKQMAVIFERMLNG